MSDQKVLSLDSTKRIDRNIKPSQSFSKNFQLKIIQPEESESTIRDANCVNPFETILEDQSVNELEERALRKHNRKRKRNQVADEGKKPTPLFICEKVLRTHPE